MADIYFKLAYPSTQQKVGVWNGAISTVEEILRFVEDEKIEMIDFKVIGTT